MELVEGLCFGLYEDTGKLRIVIHDTGQDLSYVETNKAKLREYPRNDDPEVFYISAFRNKSLLHQLLRHRALVEIKELSPVDNMHGLWVAACKFVHPPYAAAVQRALKKTKDDFHTEPVVLQENPYYANP
jgi:hypothetical protein